MNNIRVTVWNEFVHERRHESVAKIYPEGIHATLAVALRAHGHTEVKTATLEQPEHGLSREVLAETDVLLWWGHAAHERVEDEIVSRVQQRVLEGMGLIVLHSGHYSKIFRRLMGTTCMLQWRDAGERERVWVTNPGHPIAAGLGPCIEIEASEMYGEPFSIPVPDEQVFISWFEGGEVFRGGCCWHRGCGRIFFFSPGHESHPIYHHPQVQRVISNAVHWARPQGFWDNQAVHVTPERTREQIRSDSASHPELHVHHQSH